MITAAAARARVNIDNNTLLQQIKTSIGLAVESASTKLKTSVRVSLANPLEKLGQGIIIKEFEALGYTIKYASFTPH